MTFRLRHLLGTIGLLCLSLVIVDAEAAYGFWTYVGVAALFALVFSMMSTEQSPVWKGAIGGLVGWTVAVVVGQIEYVSGYWSHTGSAPYFEDGIFWGLVFLPIYVTLVFAIPCALLGSLIGGCVALVTQLSVWRRVR